MSFIKEFKKFALQGNVLDLAVAVIIGVEFGKIVNSLVNDVIMPPIGLVLGGVDFKDLVITLKKGAGEVKPVEMRFGAFIQSVINFFIVAVCIFVLIRGYNSLRDKKQPHEPTMTDLPKIETEELQVLKDIRESLRASAEAGRGERQER